MSISDWRPFVYGGVASCVAEFGTFPIDTSKTRLQIQGGHQDGQVVATRYKGMLHALLRISHEEGIRALYQGIAPAFLRQATYGTIKFGLYYSLKNALTQDPSQQHLGVNIFCGIVAGVVSSSIANPTDVLKVRLQSGHGDLRGKRLIEVVVSLYKNEGIAGFWKGVFPTAQRAGVIVGVELPLYDFCKHYFISSQYLPDNSTNHIVSSFVASLGGAIATTPIDVVRVRLMNQKMNLKALPLSAIRASSAVSSSTVRSSSSAAAALPSSVYFGTLDCFIKTVKQEGPLALYKGFVPTWLRLGPWNIIFFVTFEQLKKLY